MADQEPFASLRVCDGVRQRRNTGAVDAIINTSAMCEDKGKGEIQGSLRCGGKVRRLRSR
jgi:hypothetical protein